LFSWWLKILHNFCLKTSLLDSNSLNCGCELWGFKSLNTHENIHSAFVIYEFSITLRLYSGVFTVLSLVFAPMFLHSHGYCCVNAMLWNIAMHASGYCWIRSGGWYGDVSPGQLCPTCTLPLVWSVRKWDICSCIVCGTWIFMKCCSYTNIN